MKKIYYIYKLLSLRPRYYFSIMPTQKLNNQACQEFIEKVFTESALPSLMEYIKIPNLSRNFDPDWNKNGLLEKAAEHVKSWVEQLKIEGLKA